MYKDKLVFQAIEHELKRQQDHLELIASENIVSLQVLAAQGCVFTNKYAEGYPGRRYYRGCEHVDTAEELAIARVKQLFGCGFANVQPHSGAQANGAVFLALLQPGDTFLGMSLASGGHLTHGASVTVSGKWFNAVGYDVDMETGLIDYDTVERLAKEHKPKLIIAGGSAYTRIIDFARFRAIADSIGAILMVDMAHFAGLVAGGVYPSPFPHAHVVTSTTHKTLRGPRGGIILTNEADMAKKINSAVFPGLQGGPLMHVIAAKAVAFGEALEDDFKDYARQVAANAKAMEKELTAHGLALVSGGTDSHLLMVDLRGTGVTGEQAAAWLESVHMVCNRNSVPGDPLPPNVTSGIRIGTPAGTSRGIREPEFAKVGKWIARGIKALAEGKGDQAAKDIAPLVQSLCAQYPIYPGFKGYFG